MNDMEKLLAKAQADSDFASALLQVKTEEELKALTEEMGITIDSEELKEIQSNLKAAGNSGELSDEDLLSVSGGSWNDVLGKASEALKKKKRM